MKATYISLLLFVSFANLCFSSPVPDELPNGNGQGMENLLPLGPLPPPPPPPPPPHESLLNKVEKFISTDAHDVGKDVGEGVSKIKNFLERKKIELKDAFWRLREAASDVNGDIGYLLHSIIQKIENLIPADIAQKLSTLKQDAIREELKTLRVLIIDLQRIIFDQYKEGNNVGQDITNKLSILKQDAIREELKTLHDLLNEFERIISSEAKEVGNNIGQDNYQGPVGQ
ncbi:uncharacterized protein LOC127287601 isoform X2 [Leptopilina boulardi]|uniref:uncharacterized protein LOC127287601 isoform X2 n=1 Tax=Leptopilina boulardi TaxID=63433 RepID=UPI0021F51BD2|nr:uncharacterized protein LOC127287601 isoform X2 [Leptopilina boulardi]